MSTAELTTLPPLTVNSFFSLPDDVFKALTGFELRPWQKQTLDAWITGGVDSWAGVCSIPTGLGKSMLPVLALIASAYVDAPPRRIVYVVNRRIVVDQTYELALAAANRLRDANLILGEAGDVLRAFRALLFIKMGLDNPLVQQESLLAPHVHLLRGGTSDSLLKIGSPLIPTILVSTVDQAGSRLLMRGYGISRRTWSIQAGMLAYDTFWIIDEAHTARPLITTIGRVRRSILESSHGASLGRPLLVLEASATHGKASVPFVPGDKVESRIANAPKNVLLELFETAPKSSDFAKRATDFVRDSLDDTAASRVAVVCNTINAARLVFDAVSKSLVTHARAPRFLLLIGAIREYERRALFLGADFADLVSGVRLKQPLVVIATQTIETGPDFDFDHLMSEVASLDALVQRFGRENRRGTTTRPSGLIWGSPVVSSVYGESPVATVEILKSWGTNVLKFSPLDITKRLSHVDSSLLSRAWTPTKYPEALMGARLRDLGRTWPPNREETDVAWYLHGERSGEVEIIWRSDVSSLFDNSYSQEESLSLGRAYLDALPVFFGESLVVSTRAARAFLRDNKKSDVSDGDDGDPKDKQDDALESSRRALVLRGDVVLFVSASRVRAGDVLVVPDSYGWYDAFGFKPGSQELVLPLPRPDSLFLSADSLPSRDEDEDFPNWQHRVLSFLRARFAVSQISVEKEFSLLLDAAADVVLSVHPTLVNMYVLRVVSRFGCDQFDDSGAACDVLLADHNRCVGERASFYARSLHLSDETVSTLERAGQLHDLGKAGSQFQVMRLGNTGSSVLAKSRTSVAHVHFSYRHECGSASMVKEELPLVRHLVGTHHGYGRPGFPVYNLSNEPIRFEQNGELWETDGQENLDSLGSWWRRQFAQLQIEYSPWGLAYLEALLRLADHRTSEFERFDTRVTR